jgi:hypothetical protein
MVIKVLRKVLKLKVVELDLCTMMPTAPKEKLISYFFLIKP